MDAHIRVLPLKELDPNLQTLIANFVPQPERPCTALWIDAHVVSPKQELLTAFVSGDQVISGGSEPLHQCNRVPPKVITHELSQWEVNFGIAMVLVFAAFSSKHPVDGIGFSSKKLFIFVRSVHPRLLPRRYLVLLNHTQNNTENFVARQEFYSIDAPLDRKDWPNQRLWDVKLGSVLVPTPLAWPLRHALHEALHEPLRMTGVAQTHANFTNPSGTHLLLNLRLVAPTARSILEP
jgi:hypothetical protein